MCPCVHAPRCPEGPANHTPTHLAPVQLGNKSARAPTCEFLMHAHPRAPTHRCDAAHCIGASMQLVHRWVQVHNNVFTPVHVCAQGAGGVSSGDVPHPPGRLLVRPAVGNCFGRELDSTISGGPYGSVVPMHTRTRPRTHPCVHPRPAHRQHAAPRSPPRRSGPAASAARSTARLRRARAPTGTSAGRRRARRAAGRLPARLRAAAPRRRPCGDARMGAGPAGGCGAGWRALTWRCRRRPTRSRRGRPRCQGAAPGPACFCSPIPTGLGEVGWVPGPKPPPHPPGFLFEPKSHPWPLTDTKCDPRSCPPHRSLS